VLGASRLRLRLTTRFLVLSSCARFLTLSYFQLNGRFPRRHGDVPGAVLVLQGERLSVTPDAWFDYDLIGRCSKRHREQVRRYLMFHPIDVPGELRVRAD
jgi:hypothetical protein